MEKGELTENDLSIAGLPETTVKDDRTLIQLRTVFLTNVVQKELSRKKPKKVDESVSSKSNTKKRKRSGPSKAVRKPPAKKRKTYDDSSDTENDYEGSEDDE